MDERAISQKYNEAVSSASELETYSSELSRYVIDNYSYTITDTKNSWKSDASTMYAAKCELLKQKVKSSSSHMNRLASRIRSKAKEIYDREMAEYRAEQERLRREEEERQEALRSQQEAAQASTSGNKKSSSQSKPYVKSTAKKRK